MGSLKSARGFTLQGSMSLVATQSLWTYIRNYSCQFFHWGIDRLLSSKFVMTHCAPLDSALSCIFQTLARSGKGGCTDGGREDHKIWGPKMRISKDGVQSPSLAGSDGTREGK